MYNKSVNSHYSAVFISQALNFSFQLEDFGCVDIDECDSKICPENASCVNSEGGYKCLCFNGYEGDLCTDIDECSKNTTMCDKNADCLNTVGGYSCFCKQNFIGTGHSCSEGKCTDSLCPENQVCVGPTSMLCECRDGYILNKGECTDIDECSTQNVCSENAKCQNNNGSFTCGCNEGYYGTGDFCLPGRCPDSNCPENQKCVSATTIDCKCKEGFRFNSSSLCSDIERARN